MCVCLGTGSWTTRHFLFRLLDDYLRGVGKIDGVEIVVTLNDVDQLWELRDPILWAEASIFKKTVKVF